MKIIRKQKKEWWLKKKKRSYKLILDSQLGKTIKTKNQQAKNRLITKEYNEDKEKRKKKMKRSWVLIVVVKTEEAKVRALRSEMGKWQLRGVGESKRWTLFFFFPILSAF